MRIALALVFAAMCALFYLGVTILACFQGHALAPAAIFRFFPALNGVGESLFPGIFHGILLYAILMALWMWFGIQGLEYKERVVFTHPYL